MSNRILFIITLICFAVVSQMTAQDSLNMVRVGQWDPSGMVSYGGNTYNDIWGYTTPTGEEYAIIGNVDSILVVDITDCSNPTRVFGYDGGNTTIWRDIKTFGTYAYSVCDNCTEGLHIFDMSALPGGSVQHELTTTAFFDEAHNIYIDTAAQKLYATGTNTAIEGFVILDLSVTPEDPTLISELELDDEIDWPAANFYVHDVYVRNDTAYASHGYQGYYVWDLTDLNNIEVLGDFDANGYNHSSWTTQDGSYAYFAEEVPMGRPMHVIDLANLGHPTQDIQSVGTFQHSLGTAGGSTPHNPFIVNDTLYISYYHDGLKAYDLTNPSNPTLVGYYDTYPNNGGTYSGYDGAWGTYPFFDSGCICVSDVVHGLNIIKNCDIQFYYEDNDGDGYGNGAVSVEACESPAGWVTDKYDCDDNDVNINPGITEICDGIDNNCDGVIDENCSGLDPCDAINLYISSISQNDYHVKEEIDSDATISSSQNITYNAGVDIDLEADFEVAIGAEFLAQIDDCDVTIPIIVNEPITAVAMITLLKKETSRGGLYLLYDSEDMLVSSFSGYHLLVEYLAEVDDDRLYGLRWVVRK